MSFIRINIFLLLLVGCRTDSSSNPDYSLSASSTSRAKYSKIDIIKDDTDNPLLRDARGSLKVIDDRYEINIGDFSDKQYLLQPLKLQENIKDENIKAKKFAAATVLAAMRRLRRYYYTVPFEAIEGNGLMVTIPNPHRYPPVTIDDAANFVDGNYISDAIDETSLSWNTDGVGSMGNNLPYMPKYFSEIQAHHYVQSPHTRHGCWTTMFNVRESCTTDLYEKGKNILRSEFRTEIAAICSGHKILREGYLEGCYNARVALSVVPHHMSSYNLLWVNPKTRKFVELDESVRTSMGLKEDFKESDIAELTSVKWSEEQRKKGFINIWDYIMLQRTHAWDFEQQQAVLNEYFSDHKRWYKNDLNAKIDVNDKKDCELWRAPRPGDPEDGTQCMPNKIMKEAIISEGK
ncbi:MAG: hypothetical protein R3B45_00160 [Bdellovibrionota bacterium]